MGAAVLLVLTAHSIGIGTAAVPVAPPAAGEAVWADPSVLTADSLCCGISRRIRTLSDEFGIDSYEDRSLCADIVAVTTRTGDS